jgi:hypothetical protein
LQDPGLALVEQLELEFVGTTVDVDEGHAVAGERAIRLAV